MTRILALTLVAVLGGLSLAAAATLNDEVIRSAIETQLENKKILNGGDPRVPVEDELEIAYGESDKDVAKKVAKQIRAYSFFTVYDDVNLAVKDGHVLLKGRVTMPHKATDIEDRISRVLGVQSITNEIQTLRTSIYDDRLRVSLSNRIYRDPMFEHYAHRVNPPIHIIVDGGRVTLTGAVNSNLERIKVESIVRSTFGVFSVENRLLTDS